MPRPNPAYPDRSPFPYLDDFGNPMPTIPGQTPPNASSPSGPVSTTNPAVNPPTGVQVPAATNIDPQASAPQTAVTPATSNTAGAAGATGAGGANPVNQGTAPGTNLPRPDPIAGIGNPAVDEITAPTRQALADANAQVVQNWKDLQDTQKAYNDALAANDLAKLSQITPVLNSQYAKSIEAQRTLQTAQTNFATSVDGALKSTTVDPAQATALQAQAENSRAAANEADTRAQVLSDGADSQRQLALAQGAQASNQALLNKANADAVTAKTPQDIKTAQAQADLYTQQANQISQLLPGLIQKQAADTTLTQHQVSLTDAESDYNQALAKSATADAAMKTAQTNLLVPAQAAQAAGAGAEAQAQATTGIPAAAALNTAQAGVATQGPMYGLQQRIDAYKSLVNQVAGQVFGPGGSGKESDASDLLAKYGGSLLEQSITAAMGGTTPYAASVAAQNAQQGIFKTQAAMANQQSQAAASRANAYAGLAGGALGTLEQMNQYAPKGSTAMAGAFGNVMDYMAQRMQQGAFAPPQMPEAPQLPAFLQAFAAGHQAGTAQATAQNQAGQQSPTVNINVNGQPSGSTGAATPPAPAPTAAAAPSMTPQQAFGQGFAANAPTLPNYLGGLVSPMSMLQTAQNNPGLTSLYNQGPGAGTPTAGSLLY